MFKNIQDKLLISNPLLWNLKIVPFACIALVFHLIFFLIGYSNGEVIFKDDPYSYYDSGLDSAVVIFFSVVISILITIVWLVLYSRNNAFKSFYPKTNFSLFKEFLYIALFCALTSTFTLTYLFASDLHTRNYYSQKEISKKLEILTLSSVFLNGSFEVSNYESVEVDGQYKNQPRENFKYRGKIYSLSSLMNKRAESSDYYYGQETDSVMSKRVKNWMFENRKDSIKWVFDEFIKMAKEEKLSTNITSEKWFSLVYDYPEFTNYTIINRSKNQSDYNSPYETAPYVTDSTGVAMPVENVKQPNSTYYVPYQSLLDGYKEISKAHENPTINLDSLYFYLYFAIGLAIAIFSFKVTSGRNWLIAMVSLGVVSLIIGIFSAMSGGTAFFIFYWLIFIGLLIHFFATVSARAGKGISGITLNQILWLFPSVAPMLYFCILDIAKSSSNYYANSGKYVNGVFINESFPKITWMEEHFPEMMIANIAVIIIFVFLFSVQIKKWKGIAED
jgi:hypothetical protein